MADHDNDSNCFEVSYTADEMKDEYVELVGKVTFGDDKKGIIKGIGTMPTEGQTRAQEVRTDGTRAIFGEYRPARSEASGKEVTPQVAAGRKNEDRMTAMIDTIK
ncbi:hypothetical protein ACLOJK_027454 [Asimina triloba]